LLLAGWTWSVGRACAAAGFAAHLHHGVSSVCIACIRWLAVMVIPRLHPRVVWLLRGG
jgi:hypothetical protein